jgi:Zn-dependent M28 family amino/carboxypeptidase
MKYLFTLILILATNVAFSQQAVDLKAHVEALSAQSRVTGSEGCQRANEYIVAQLVASGYKPESQPFNVRGRNAANVLADRVGSLDTVIVVGAHYDSARCPGADDNASGTAAVLELAKMLKTSRRTILFILFSGEEDGLVGSEYYVKHPRYPINKTICMLNLDMIGYLSNDRQDYVPDVSKILKDLYLEFPFAPGIVIRGGTSSDQEPFDRIGIKCAFLHTGLHGNYHRASDTPDKLNYEGMEQIVRFSFALINALDKHDLPDYDIMRAQ